MLHEPIRALIAAEQSRLDGRFVEGVDFDAYLSKLAVSAEFLADLTADRCRGFVAYYCNDEATKQAYITLVLVDPQDRGSGLGRSLVAGVLDIARRRGFTSCRLEVAKRNAAAYALYLSMGFGTVEDRGGKDLLEIAL